jgi:hypothetical protein
MPVRAPRWLVLVFVATVVMSLALPALTQTKASKAVKRAQPPKFDRTDAFYADAFKEGLVGQRPTNLSQAAATAAAGNPSSSSGSGATGVPGSGWASLITATTLEDEVKALKLQIDQTITTPSDFAGKGYKAARRDFTMLAMLFGIAGEYESDVRWKKEAPAARNMLARTAANAKVGTSQVFQEAKLRKEELTDLLGGGGPFAGKEADFKATWKDVCGRAPLMQHLNVVWEPKLKPMLADQGQFTANAARIQHDAQIISAVGEVLAKEGMVDAESDEYKAFCFKLRDGAKAIVEAVKLKNFEAAASGSATITKACADCHDNYRS